MPHDPGMLQNGLEPGHFTREMLLHVQAQARDLQDREADLNEERSLNRQLTHSSKIHALEVVNRDRMIMDMRAEIRDLTGRIAAQKTFIEKLQQELLVVCAAKETEERARREDEQTLRTHEEQGDEMRERYMQKVQKLEQELEALRERERWSQSRAEDDLNAVVQACRALSLLCEDCRWLCEEEKTHGSMECEELKSQIQQLQLQLQDAGHPDVTADDADDAAAFAHNRLTNSSEPSAQAPLVSDVDDTDRIILPPPLPPRRLQNQDGSTIELQRELQLSNDALAEMIGIADARAAELDKLRQEYAQQESLHKDTLRELTQTWEEILKTSTNDLRQQVRDQQEMMSLNWDFTTLGFEYNSSSATITSVVFGGPAYVSNMVFKGDIIVRIDGRPIKNGSEVESCLKGTYAPGSKVVFILRRASGEEVEVTLRRNAGKLKLDTDVQVQELSLAVALLEDEKRMLAKENERLEEMRQKVELDNLAQKAAADADRDQLRAELDAQRQRFEADGQHQVEALEHKLIDLRTQHEMRLTKHHERQKENLERSLRRILNLQLSLAWTAMSQATLGKRSRTEALRRALAKARLSDRSLSNSLSRGFQRLRVQVLQGCAVRAKLMRWRQRCLAACWEGWLRNMETNCFEKKLEMMASSLSAQENEMKLQARIWELEAEVLGLEECLWK